MAHKKGTEPEPKKTTGGPVFDGGADKHRGSQTEGQNEQDTARRIGNFGGAGEPPRKQPGPRQ